MAKDVAQREIDQSGFRISNLGDPQATGDATKTDNAKLHSPVGDFYMTNPIARASAIMAECSQMQAGLKQAAE